MPKKSYEHDIRFLFEMGSIRYIQRMWQRFNTPQFANLAEHHFRVFWISMIIAKNEKNVDIGRVAKMAMVHDIAESRTGDVDILSRQYVERNEELGITDMLDGTSLQDEFFKLWQEYEDRSSIEAKIVKDADNLDVDFELAERAEAGSTIQTAKAEIRNFVSTNKLYTKTAKEIFQQINHESPHAWWLNSRNRRESGDWKK